jgi:hypothetical protein
MMSLLFAKMFRARLRDTACSDSVTGRGKVLAACMLFATCLPTAVWAGNVERVPDDAKKDLPAAPESFRNYVPYAVDYAKGYGAGSFLFLAPGLAAKATMFKQDPDAAGYSVAFHLNGAGYVISYDAGPSEDPGFTISSEQLKEPVVLSGEILFVSGSGGFYVSDRSDQNYTVKLKYMLVKGTLQETKQPYYYVNLDCKTSAVLVMYSEPCNKGHVVASIPSGESVKVLLNETTAHCEGGSSSGQMSDQYLVATSFGLIGWTTSTSGYIQNVGKPLSCLSFDGD